MIQNSCVSISDPLYTTTKLLDWEHVL